MPYWARGLRGLVLPTALLQRQKLWFGVAWCQLCVSILKIRQGC